MLSLFMRNYFSEFTCTNNDKLCRIFRKTRKNMNQGFRFRHTYIENEGIVVPPYV